MEANYPSPFHTAAGVAYTMNLFFVFEEDFVEQNVRCIPMIVRFKLDACGIKLKLNEWSKLSVDERKQLAEMDCSIASDIRYYRQYLQELVIKRTRMVATDLAVEQNPVWADTRHLPALLVDTMGIFSWDISLRQWRDLNNLQRFVLLKLCRPGHENRNFPFAVKEFGLIN